MTTHKKLAIGLFGFGVVGEGIYQVLQQTPSLNASIKKVCIKHPQKKRNAEPALFTTDYNEILADPDINLIVELIDDADEAYEIVTTAFKNGKSVVSANKKMIAEHLAELISLQRQQDVSFLYEAAVCGSIPIIRNLEEYYDNDLLQSISGIVNGSTNYILTKMSEGLNYKEALLQAQQLGFAESNPKLDVEGIDAVNKLTILLAHAYGVVAKPEDLISIGIHRLQEADANFAREKNFKIKLTAQTIKLSNGEVAAFVLPQFIKNDSQLFNVSNEYNGVIIESKLADKQFLYGKGAGRFPTSSAVVSDISALTYDYRYEYKKISRHEQYSLAHKYYLRVYVSFKDWDVVSRLDFEQVFEFHGTEQRQYITGLIEVQKLREARWYKNPSVSIILLPEAVIENEDVAEQTLKKKSLQLAGVLTT
jgi:homoserine dehydrogenase